MDAPSILVVEDMPYVGVMLQRVLEYAGYVVRLASNGQEALREIAENPPRVILLDLQMPHLDGANFAKRLKEQGGDIPIIVVSASHTIEDSAAEINAHGHLAKPFRLIDLFGILNDVCFMAA